KKEKKSVLAQEKEPELSDADDTPVFTLTGVRFSQSRLLSKEALQSLVAPWLGQAVSYADLQRLIISINHLYREKKIYTAVAVFPEQQVENGVIAIRLIEGSVGEVVLEGNEYTADEYIHRWIDKGEQEEAIDVAALESNILFYNRIHDQRLQAELRAGKAFGLTDVIIHVPEASRDAVNLYVDNYGYKSTGEEQLSLLYQRHQLFRSGDKFKAYALGSAGIKSLALQYDLPLGADGWRWMNQVQYTDSDLSEGDLSELDVTGNSLQLATSASYLLYSDVDLWVSLLGGFSRTDSENTIASQDLSDYRTDRYRGGIQFDWQGDQWQLTGQYDHYWLRSHEKVSDNKRMITLDKAQLTYIYNFDSPFYAIAAFEAQLTSDEALPGAASYSLGGASALRGYRPGAVSGDKGWYQILEIHNNGLAYANYTFDLFGFYDHGQVESGGDWITPSSAGFGVNISNNDDLSLDVIAAKTLRNITLGQDSSAVYARLSWSLWE
ncbi:hypothetical protein N9V90_02960, partial [Endozoicomonas sp.]|nr:hypothetical protein [Endozoicomonas sp.]